MFQQRLGQMLLDARLITAEQLHTAERIQAENPRRQLDEILISCGFLPESALHQALEQQLGVAHIDPCGISIPKELAGLVSEAIAKKFVLVPVSADAATIRLAMANPLDHQAADAVRLTARRSVIPMLAAPTAIQRAIADLYGSVSAEQALLDLQTAAAPSPREHDPASIDDDRDAAPTIRLVNRFLEYAVSQEASDIHLEPREREMVVRMRIDGLLRQTFTIPHTSQRAVIARVKVMGGMDIAEHRIPQDGRSHIRIGNREIDLRISTLPTVHGEKAVIRLLHRSPDLLTARGIGLAGTNLQKFQALLESGSGMILIAGPTGSGKSSTMYTMIDALNNGQVNLVTLEDPVEYHFDGVNQVQINEKTGMTFASGLRAVLRQDPDILAVGEIRDRETADIAMRAAITGHLVLSTIHTRDALGTIDRLLDMDVERFLLSAALKGILAQRLVRRICPGCREAYTPTPEEQTALHLPVRPDRTFYRGRGCPRCFHTGYRGRTAVFEILTVDSDLRRAIAGGASRSQLAARVSERGFQPLLLDCIRLVESGVTTTEEALRTIRSVL